MLRDRSLVPLSQQHHNGLALCVLTRRALAAGASADLAALARRITDRYELELANHFEIEEQVLFTEIERNLGALPILADLLREHRELERLVGELRRGPSAGLLEQFCDLLTRHIRREENELFEATQQRLPREVLDRLGHLIDAKAVRICL